MQCRKAYEGLPHNYKRFVDIYVIQFDAAAAAVEAGLSKKTAAAAGSRLLCKPEVSLAVAYVLEEKTKLARIDAAWVLKRLALLADFSIKRFIVVDPGTGKPYYDFAAATDEDWYCIDEITIDALRGRVREGTKIYVDSVKLKTVSKLAALKEVGNHTDVQAFRERAERDTGRKVTEVIRTIIKPGLPPPEPKKIAGATGT